MRGISEHLKNNSLYYTTILAGLLFGAEIKDFTQLVKNKVLDIFSDSSKNEEVVKYSKEKQYWVGKTGLDKVLALTSQKEADENPVKVLVLDSCIYNAFNNLNLKIEGLGFESFKLFENKIMINEDASICDHGEGVSSIIASKKDNNYGMLALKNVETIGVDIQRLDLLDKLDNYVLLFDKVINYAIDNNVDIINFSFNIVIMDIYSLRAMKLTSPEKYIEILEKYIEIYNSIKKAYNKGIIIITSAGNDGVNDDVFSIFSLTNDDIFENDTKTQIFGVGSLDKKGEKSYFSNYGRFVDFYTYGEEIFVAGLSGKKLSNKEFKPKPDYNFQSGTSLSAPILTAGIAALKNKFGNIPTDILYDALKEGEENGGVNFYNTYLILEKKLAR